MNRDIVQQVLRDFDALRRPDTDPELDAVRTAILLEDVFGVALSDAEIDSAVLSSPSPAAALVTLVTRLQGAG